MKRTLASVLTGALITMGAIVGVAAPASAAGPVVTGGSLTWALDPTYTSIFATRANEAPATWIEGNTVAHFITDAAASTYDPETETGTIAFGGAVRAGYIAGAPVPGVFDGNYIYLKSPRIVIEGDTGRLVAGTVAGSSHKLNPGLPTHSGTDITFATLDLSAGPVATETGATWQDVPASITTAGAAYFALFEAGADTSATPQVRAAGSALAPLTFSVTHDAAPTATQTSLTVDPVGTSVAEAPVTLTATVTPAAAGTVTFADATRTLGTVNVVDGVASVDVSDLAVGAHSLTATFAPQDATAHAASASNAVAHTVTAKDVDPGAPEDPAQATVVVSKTSGLNPEGETVTVTGSGFVPHAPDTNGTRPPLAGAFTGAYVVFGSFLDSWKPSEGVGSAARKSIAQKWGVHAAQMNTIGGAASGAIEIAPDGTFSTELLLSEAEALEGGNWGVYTYAGGGAKHAPFETYTPITFAAVEEPETPSMSLSVGTVQQGGQLTVSGTGFAENDTVTVTVNSDPFVLGTAIVGGTGRFSVTGTVPASFATGAHTVTVSVNGVVLASQGLTVTALPVLAPTPAVEAPQAPSCVARSVSGATIQWGVKESFRSYITGPIANGQISGGWGSGSGAYSTENDRGRVSFGGSLNYSGHGGLLDVSLSNPRIQITGPNSASLILNVQSKGYNGSPDVNANGVVFATLSLPAAAETANRISWNGASATLTAAGAEAFAGFYNAGDALDAVSFAFPLGAEVPCDTTTDATLAATGGEAPLNTVWLGAAALLLGALAISIARRRRAEV